MKVTKDAITELTKEDRELLWEALGVYYQHCAYHVEMGHCGKDTFKHYMEMMEPVMDVAYVAWERTYH